MSEWKDLEKFEDIHPPDEKEHLIPVEGSQEIFERVPFSWRRRTIIFFCLIPILGLIVRWHTSACNPAWTDVKALECHHKVGVKKLERLLRLQSRTPSQAIAKYKKKYKRNPPQGFAEWAEFALQNGSPIIDDYDQLEADLAPLRAIPSNILKKRVQAGREQGRIKLAGIRNGTIFVGNDPSPKHKKAKAVEALIKPIANRLPDMEWLMNWADRQVVLGSSDSTQIHNVTTRLESFTEEEAWSTLRSRCPKDTRGKSQMSSDRPSIELCSLDDESPLRFKHGNFGSSSFAFQTSLPVISLGKFSSFEDIIAPAWCYAEYGYRVHPNDEIPSFDSRKNALYWRGSVTGLQSPNSRNWHTNHRTRILLKFAQFKEYLQESQIGNRISLLDRVRNLGALLAPLSQHQEQALSNLSADTFDVGFSKTDMFSEEEKQKDPLVTTAIESLFEKLPQFPGANAFQHKFLLDIDGNTMSCRYYRLMGGGGLIFKQTQWVEWHDDRLVPFVHYVPIDIDADRIPQYLDIFINSQKGKDIARKIANTGKHWYSTGLRKIDMTVYYYRLLLELSSILNDT